MEKIFSSWWWFLLACAVALQAYHTLSTPAVAHTPKVCGEGKIYDITHRLVQGMPAFGSVNGTGQIVNETRGRETYYGTIKLNTHMGTHIDSPGHLFKDYYESGLDIDSVDLQTLNGMRAFTVYSSLCKYRVTIVEVDVVKIPKQKAVFYCIRQQYMLPFGICYTNGTSCMPSPVLVVDTPRDKNITAEVLKSLNLPSGLKRVIFRTLNTDRGLMRQRAFESNYTGFTPDGAEWLVNQTQIKLIGIDYLSVAVKDEVVKVHQIFLRPKDIIPVECLKLDEINPGYYTVHCLPLRLPLADGSPARCILMEGSPPPPPPPISNFSLQGSILPFPSVW